MSFILPGLRITWNFLSCSAPVVSANPDDEFKGTTRIATVQFPASLGTIHTSGSGNAPVQNSVKFTNIVRQVDEQLALLALPCKLLTTNLSITLDQLSSWSGLMSEQDSLHYAKRVIPTLVLYLRSTYPFDGPFTNWLQNIAQPESSSYSYTTDHRFLTLQALHKCIPSHLRPALLESQGPSDRYFQLVVSTLSTLLSLAPPSGLSLKQTMTDSIAIDLARFETVFFRMVTSIWTMPSPIKATQPLQDFPLPTLVEKADISAEARKEVQELIDQYDYQFGVRRKS